jgi:uncharacterized protein YkwD
MAKQKTKNKNNNIFKQTPVKVRVAIIVVFAILGSLLVTGIFAQSKKNDYSLKVPTERTLISLSDEKPLTVSKDSNGKITYQSRGKSIDVTTTGTVYCTPEGDGSVKIATLTPDELSKTLSQVENSNPTQNISKQDYSQPSIGNTKQLQISSGSNTKTVENDLNKPPQNIASTEEILNQICAKSTQEIPPTQVPEFIPKTINKEKFKQSSIKSPLSYITPKANAAGGTTPTAPAIYSQIAAPEIEADHVARINYERAIRGIPQMGRSDCLTRSARTWSANMSNVNILHHSNLFGLIELECGKNWWAKLGENVGTGGSLDGYTQFLAYMNSPGHRANILDPSFQRVGIGANRTTYSNGVVVVWTTQHFATCIGSCANK